LEDGWPQGTWVARFNVSLFKNLHLPAYMNIFISTWVTLTAGLIFVLPMLIARVKENTGLAEETMVRMDQNGRVKDVPEIEGKDAGLGKENEA
jgi:hypothetical protein